MTESEICESIGLDDSIDFRLQAMRRNLSDERVAMVGKEEAMRSVYRCTGRTTSIIVKAIAWVSEDVRRTARFLGRYQATSRNMARTAGEMARRIGLSPGRFVPDYSNHPEQTPRDTKLFVDHEWE